MYRLGLFNALKQYFEKRIFAFAFSLVTTMPWK